MVPSASSRCQRPLGAVLPSPPPPESRPNAVASRCAWALSVANRGRQHRLPAVDHLDGRCKLVGIDPDKHLLHDPPDLLVIVSRELRSGIATWSSLCPLEPNAAVWLSSGQRSCGHRAINARGQTRKVAHGRAPAGWLRSPLTCKAKGYRQNLAPVYAISCTPDRGQPIRAGSWAILSQPPFVCPGKLTRLTAVRLTLCV